LNFLYLTYDLDKYVDLEPWIQMQAFKCTWSQEYVKVRSLYSI